MNSSMQGQSPGGGLSRIPVGKIRPNPFQPRKTFGTAELAELETSIQANGLLQPITVRPSALDGGFELIAGERRLRAVTKLGWSDIPAIVKEADDRTLLTLALVENLQRSDLNPLDEAEGYRRLMQEFGATQQQVAEVVGKDRVTISNALRLLNLPAAVRGMLSHGKITPGHARPLLGLLPNERKIIDLAREVVAAHLSVREVERRVMQEAPERRRSRKSMQSLSTVEVSQPGEIRGIEDELRAYLQTDVRLQMAGDKKGTLSISFYSAEDLERIMTRIGVPGERS
ncbi:MAG: ParB/RepB/Spo0J family partition protein [Anaerolineae bacterium]|nr:ParB/RepB/Spo0J family partition protein [Gemmatimonadaceae bacterium]